MDLFGKALMDYQTGADAFDFTIHRDDGHIDSHNVGIYFEPEPFAFEVPALAFVKGSVLDIGCGAGRHVLWMQKKGHQAQGVDLSADAVAVCKLRGCNDVSRRDVMAGLGSVLVDTFTLFGNNAGIGGTFEGTTKLFRKLRSHVTKGGRLILTGIEIASTNDPAHLNYHAKNLAQGRRRGEIKMQFEYRGARGDWIAWYHPEPHEIREIAAATGWDVTQITRFDNGFFLAVLDAAQKTP